MASISSAIPAGRDRSCSDCREIWRREQDVVMDGRDIGTNILPDADVKDLSDSQRPGQEQNADI